jgi:Na+/melibiose symporter-like transporter
MFLDLLTDIALFMGNSQVNCLSLVGDFTAWAADQIYHIVLTYFLQQQLSKSKAHIFHYSLDTS